MTALSKVAKLVVGCTLVLSLASSNHAAAYRIEPDDYAEGADFFDVPATVRLRIYDGYIYTFPENFGVFPSPTVIPVTANENADILGGYFTSTGTKTFGHADIPFFSESRQLGMQFLTLTSQVTIDFIGTNTLASQVGVLQVYSRLGTLLDTVTSAPLMAHQLATLSLTRPLGDIGYARAYSSPTANPFGALDNLRFVTSVSGDFNVNGVADAGDYAVWRKGLGTQFNQNHFLQWRQNFGGSGGAGAGSELVLSIPEPAVATYLIFIALARCVFRSRQRSA